MTRLHLVVVSMCLITWVTIARAADGATPMQVDRSFEKLSQDQDAAEGERDGLAQIAEHVSIGGVISGAYQYQWISGPADTDDKGRGALSFQPEVSITPTKNDEIFLKFGFGAGNGLPGVSPFVQSPWAAGLEDDVKDINGRNRDYLLQAWYQHTFALGDDHSLGLTGGIIDSTDYLDDNAYANDEYTQFMNETFTNASNGFLPSWDAGGALVWDLGRLGVRGVYMNVGENDDGNEFNFYGAQGVYALDSDLGEGHYRVNYVSTDKEFLNPDETSKERIEALIFSFDQELGDIYGAWARLSFSSDDALVDYESAYTGGINISGKRWGREQDNIGVAYGYLDGAEQTGESIKYSHVFEGYVRFGLNESVSLTFDLQYMKDKYVGTASENDVDGWVAGARMAAEF